MKVFYIPKTPFGEFFYDPDSHEGVAISESGPVVLGMAADYNPRIHLDYKECEVDDGVFSQLRGAALRYNSAVSDLQRALRHFPRAEIHSSPDRH